MPLDTSTALFLMLIGGAIGYNYMKTTIEGHGTDVVSAKKDADRYGYIAFALFFGSALVANVSVELGVMLFGASIGFYIGIDSGLKTVKNKAQKEKARKHSHCSELQNRLDEINRKIQQLYSSRGGNPIADLGKQATVLRLMEEKEKIEKQLKEKGC